MRSRILGRLRGGRARATTPPGGRRWLTFVVVGAGPTGVEMAGQIAELARDTLRRDFRVIDTRTARILLVEADDRVLTSFPPSLSAKAVRSLRAARRRRRSSTIASSMVDASGVTIEDADGDVGARRRPDGHLGRRRHRVEPRRRARAR